MQFPGFDLFLYASLILCLLTVNLRQRCASALAGLGLSLDPEEKICVLGQVKVGITMEEEQPKLTDFFYVDGALGSRAGVVGP